MKTTTSSSLTQTLLPRPRNVSDDPTDVPYKTVPNNSQGNEALRRVQDPQKADHVVDLAYEVLGEDNRPVLLLLHGGTSSRHAWDLVMPALMPLYRVVTVDLRGHGQSPAPDSGYSALELSEDISRLIDKLDLRDITVAGHSLGGMAAIYLSARRAEIVSKLVLINVPVTPNTIPAFAVINTRLSEPAFFPVTQAFLDEWCPPLPTVPADFHAAKQAHLRALRPVVWQQIFAELVKADVTPILQEIRQPTLILWGAKDALLDAKQHTLLRAGIENSQLVMIRTAGHTPSAVTPNRVAAEIATFAASQYARRRGAQ